MNASGSAKSRMERVLRLQEEIDQIKGDIREIYAEEKADGGDKTAMGAAISYIRKRAKDKNAFDEREALASVYINAFEASGTAFATHTHAGEASQSYTEAKSRESTTPKVSNSKASSAETADLGTTPYDKARDESILADEVAA
jgi:uncharacterized protein (UPF0335 family)